MAFSSSERLLRVYMCVPPVHYAPPHDFAKGRVPPHESSEGFILAGNFACKTGNSGGDSWGPT